MTQRRLRPMPPLALAELRPIPGRHPQRTVRDLQTATGASTRIASNYNSFGHSFTINVNLTDGNTHRVALYLLDWDTFSRAESITITDAVSGAVLNTQNFSNLHNGVWAVWTLKWERRHYRH
jgi:hypothetical protein